MENGSEGAIVLEPMQAPGPSDHPQSVARRRALPKMSVRALLALVLVSGCGLGLHVEIERTAQIQRSAVAAIYQAGGWVVYDTEWYGGNPRVWKLWWPEWLVKQMGVDYFGNVVFINLHDRGTDAVMKEVGKLKKLRQLHRAGLAVTDRGLAHLVRLRKLELLSLEDTLVTDAGLRHLKKLSSLKWIKLKHTQVTDVGLAELRKIRPHLEVIR
jgi:hypothetical protein